MSSDHASSSKDHTVIDIGSENCIFEVPRVLRRKNPKAYTPDVVTIGPFHHHKENKGKLKKEFQRMKQAKQTYLEEVLARMGTITLKDLTDRVTKLSDQENKGAYSFETRARRFYGEPLVEHIQHKDFMEMMIVDGCFLVQLFRKYKNSSLRTDPDPVFSGDHMLPSLCHDILLLENQLPWFVIHCMYTLTLDKYPDEASLSTLILNAFSMLPLLNKSCLSYLNKCPCDSDYLHILDLLRTSLVSPLKTTGRTIARIGRGAGREDVFDGPTRMHTATALLKAGFIIKPVNCDSILDIRFQLKSKKNKISLLSRSFDAILKIPRLNIDSFSECIFRNLIAIEQCYHGYHSREVTSYAMFMNNLISSEEDLELLCKEKVVVSTNAEDYKFFSSRVLQIDIQPNKFYYDSLCHRVNKQYYKLQRHQLGENTRQQLIWFSNPWNAFYAIVGVLLLQVVPTLLQTTYSIMQYYNSTP